LSDHSAIALELLLIILLPEDKIKPIKNEPKIKYKPEPTSLVKMEKSPFSIIIVAIIKAIIITPPIRIFLTHFSSSFKARRALPKLIVIEV